MAHITCEMMWLKSLLQEMGFFSKVSMKMFCDNQVAMTMQLIQRSMKEQSTLK